jgi:hypothetical protein
LPLSEWITNLARSSFVVDAGLTLSLGRLGGDVFDKYAPP